MSSLTILIWSLSLTGFSNSNRAMLLAIVLRSYPGCRTILFTETGVSVPSSLLRLNSPEDKYRLLNNWTANNKKTKQKNVKTNKAQTIRLGSILTLWLLSLDERIKTLVVAIWKNVLHIWVYWANIVYVPNTTWSLLGFKGVTPFLTWRTFATVRTQPGLMSAPLKR